MRARKRIRQSAIQPRDRSTSRSGGVDSRVLTFGRLRELQSAAGNRAIARLFARTTPDAQPFADRGTRPRERSQASGLPDALKSGVERISGVSLDRVRVHYNSEEPARYEALAFAQGRDIYLAPHQERHLPHEVWHIVQQAQGRVRPTSRSKGGVAVNDDPALEHEADVMGHHVRPGRGTLDGTPLAAGPLQTAGLYRRAGIEATAGGAPPAVQCEKKEKKGPVKTSEERAPDSKDYMLTAVDDTKLVFDPFDQTLTVILAQPNAEGIQGYQFIYELDNRPGETPMITRYTLSAELTPNRIVALQILSKRQGGVQEDAITGPAGRKAYDKAEGDKERAKVAKENDKFMAEYKEKLAALKEGEKPPAPPKLKPPPEDKKSTLCNDFPVEIATAIGITVPDKQKGGNAKTIDDGKLRNFDPKVEGLKRGSWRTLKDQPSGPLPGDVYSLGLANNPEKIQHLGVIKSRRPGKEKNTETWTVVDGGQGTYETQQKILERTRTFHLDTKLLTTMLADAGQDDSDRSLRGWIDIETHFKRADTTV